MMILLALTTNVRLLSPTYTIPLTCFILFFLVEQRIEVPLFHHYFEQLDESIYPTLVILLGILLIAEGFMIRSNGAKIASPQLTLSKRGQTIGRYALRRIWLLPMFVFIPSSELPSPFSWYPIFSIGESAYSTDCFTISDWLYTEGSRNDSRTSCEDSWQASHVLRIFHYSLSGCEYWYPLLAIVTAVIAL